MTDLITNYLACWNETDADARRALIDQHWSQTATYVDPMAEATGSEAINASFATLGRDLADQIRHRSVPAGQGSSREPRRPRRKVGNWS